MVRKRTIVGILTVGLGVAGVVVLTVIGTNTTPKEPWYNKIKTELQITKTRFGANEPIIVDVYVKNTSGRAVDRPKFSPVSSDIGLPDFMFVRVPDGKEFYFPAGLFGDDWDSWYQPASGKEVFSPGPFAMPAGKRIHLLHGDLRLTVLRARKHCQDTLDQRFLLERAENATTNKEYQNIVRFADEFLNGGTYDICVRAYSKSNVVRIRIDGQGKKTTGQAPE